MSFEQAVRIPTERVAVIIGKKGVTRKGLEDACHVQLDIDSKVGEVRIKSNAVDGEADPFHAVSIIEAIGRGFSPQRAMRLLRPEATLEVIDLRDYAGKSENALLRIRGRIIGLHGKSRRVLEELTSCYVSVYGRTVAIIGEPSEMRLAKEAIEMLASGSEHRSVYKAVQREKTKRKMERMLLWEDQSPEIAGISQKAEE